jgi:hypothetical protein
MNKYLPLFVAAVLAAPAIAAGQGAAPQGAPQIMEVDPIRCWWRTSSGAVRVGEAFSVVLTCAVLQNDAVQVVPDETRLDSSVAQMAPWEVIGGSHPADLYSGSRRFFQYEYRLRIINPDVLGKDIKIPDPQIHYRVNSSVGANAALQGREHTYLMPPHSVRVLSLVPVDAPDIRDASNDGFAAAEQLGFRANVLQIVAVTAMALGVLVAILGLARLVVRAKKGRVVEKRGLSDFAVARVASRELSAVQREAEGGWNDRAIGRALAATRLAGAKALGRTVSQREARGVEPAEGQIGVGRGIRRKAMIVSGATTSEEIGRVLDKLPPTVDARRREMLENFQSALMTFSTAQYSRQAPIDRGALDEALAKAISATGKLKSELAWPMAYFRRLTPRLQAQQEA